MKTLVFFLALTLSGVASAQGRRAEGGAHGKQQMRQEDRQRMREDMNQVYRDRNARPERPARPMSPQEREKLRKDVQDANKQMKR
jgi:hypothetical protein